MASVSKEQIAKAREVDLLDYLLTHEPSAIRREGRNYRHQEHDSLVYFGSKGYWYWNSRGKSINALDYLMEIRGYRLVDAVKHLTGDQLLRNSEVKQIPKDQREKTSFRLPEPKVCSLALIPYLQKRGISDAVILRCLQENILYESRINRKPVCVFIGKDDQGEARFGCIRSTQGNLRKDITGSDKRFSFCYPPDHDCSKQLAVFEAPIDALSHASLQQHEGWKWNGYRLALCGTSPVALYAFLERHPEITRVVLHMDNDRAGIINARRIKAAMAQDRRFKHIRVSVNPPRQGKDYNDVLIAQVLKERDSVRAAPQPRHGER